MSDSPDPQNVVLDLARDTISEHGLYFRITVPGVGIVVVHAGTTFIDADGSMTFHGRLNASGRQEVLDALCAALE